MSSTFWRSELDRLVRTLARTRVEAGLTTEQVADLAGTTQSVVSAVLTGRHTPLAYTLVRMADALGYRVELVPKNEADLATLEPHEAEVALDESNPTGKLDGVDGVGIGNVSKDPSVARCACVGAEDGGAVTIRPQRAAVADALERAARRSNQTVDRVSVITFRVTPQERAMLDMVAFRQNESLSAFVRSSALDVARAIIESEGGAEEFARGLHLPGCYCRPDE